MALLYARTVNVGNTTFYVGFVAGPDGRPIVKNYVIVPPKGPPKYVTVGDIFGDAWGALSGGVSDLAGAIAGLGSDAIHAIGNVASAVASGTADVSGAVWHGVVSAASDIGQLPGIHQVIGTVEDATKILDAILDSPITAVVVLALSTALSEVGLGSGLMAEYVALRAGMDLLVKVENGDTIGITDLANLTLSAASGATGLPLNAAMPAIIATQKIASGQSLSPNDIANLTIAAATVAAAGSSADADAFRAIKYVGAAKTIALAATASGTATAARKQMPDGHLDKTNVHKLPDPVARHLLKQVPAVAAQAIQNSPAGQSAVTSAMQHAQIDIIAAEQASAVLATRQVELEGTGASLVADSRMPRAMNTPGNPDILDQNAYGQFLAQICDFVKTGGDVSPNMLTTLQYFQTALNLPAFVPDLDSCSDQSTMLAMTTPATSMMLHRSLRIDKSAPRLSLTAEFLSSRTPASAPPVIQSGGVMLRKAPSYATDQAFMSTPNPLQPVGLPPYPPPYHLPLGYGPMNPARDIG